MDRAVDVIRNAGLGCTDNFSDGGSVAGSHRTLGGVFQAVNATNGPDRLTVVTGVRPLTIVSGVDPGTGNPMLRDLQGPDGRNLFDTARNRYVFFAPYEYNRFVQILNINPATHLVTLSDPRTVSTGDSVLRVNAYTLALDRNGSAPADVDGDGASSDENDNNLPDFYIYDNTHDLMRDADATDVLERAGSARIAEGIEDLQFEYAWDQNEDGVIAAGEYLSAGDPNFDPDQVRVVRIYLLGRTSKPDPHFEDQNASYTVADHTIALDTNDTNGIESAFDHHFHRQLLVETVMVRNLNL
jgi:hypothetical protein